ncbi:spore coat protein B [Bacillus mycoides]
MPFFLIKLSSYKNRKKKQNENALYYPYTLLRKK